MIIPLAVYHKKDDDGVIYLCTQEQRVLLSETRCDRPEVELAVELLIWKFRAIQAENALNSLPLRGNGVI